MKFTLNTSIVLERENNNYSLKGLSGRAGKGRGFRRPGARFIAIFTVNAAITVLFFYFLPVFDISLAKVCHVDRLLNNPWAKTTGSSTGIPLLFK